MSNTKQCALCLKQNQLKKSHFMPRGLYRKVRNTELPADSNPLLVDAKTKKTIQTSVQFQKHVLCGYCEQLFSEKGENIVIPDLQDAYGFDLVDKKLNGNAAINALTPNASHEIDIDAYAYFALSIFWRGSIHKWGIKIQKMYKRLRSHEESIRQYLLDSSSGFPADVHITMLINKDVESFVGMSFPQHSNVLNYKNGTEHFGFCVPGVWFDVAIGSNLDNSARSCFDGLEIPLSVHYVSFAQTRIYEMAHQAINQSKRVN